MVLWSKKKGVITLHDNVVHITFINAHISDYWIEIKNKFRYQEIVEDWKQKEGGIGILRNKK